MKYFSIVNYLYNQGENNYKLLSTVLADNLIGAVMPHLEGYLKYCITLFVDGDIDKYWQEVSCYNDDMERRKIYDKLLVEISDEERNKRFRDYLDDNMIVTMGDEVYDILSDNFVDNFYKILETNFEDYIWDAKHTK